MLNEFLEYHLRRADTADITEIFLVALLACLAAALACAWAGRWRRFTAYAPTLLTSLGILGTFVGIVVGLLGFDPQEIDQSIGTLLNGLKTAFITSVVGMGASILFKLVATTPLFAEVREREDTSGAGPEDVLQAIREQTELVRGTRDAIAGREESSLAG